MTSIGFIINPYAGMGGAVGLKGTDNSVKEAISLGAEPQSATKALRFLSGLKEKDIHFFTVNGEMGENVLRKTNLSYTIVYHSEKKYLDPLIKTSAADTKKACLEIMKAHVDLLIFCGGDGTAKDVFSCTGNAVPILGIPTGVKIFSGVFATTPESAVHILSQWNGNNLIDGEVLDVDEEEYRNGNLKTALFGIAKIPYVKGLCQCSKQVSFGDEADNMEGIANFIIEIMQDDTLYLLGAGTTTKKIADTLNISKTLLGIDAIYQKKLLKSDLNEKEILTLLNYYDKVKIIISPIGAQGFILGRGNQQISRDVIKKIGINSLIVIASESKLQNTKSLFIDTGDPDLNSSFNDSILVISNYKMGIRKKLIH